MSESINAGRGQDGTYVPLRASEGNRTDHPTSNVLRALQRDAIKEIMGDFLLSWDKMALLIGVETGILRWWMNDWPPDNARRGIAIRTCGVKVERYLNNYVAPEKPRPERSKKMQALRDDFLPKLHRADKVR